MSFDDTVATLAEILLANKVPQETVNKAIAELRRTKEQEKESKPKKTKAKTQVAILVSDPEGRLKGMELFGYAFQMEADAAPQMAHSRLLAAASYYNGSRKGNGKNKVKTLGEAVQGLRGKYLKQERADQKFKILSREAIPLQTVPHDLPKEVVE